MLSDHLQAWTKRRSSVARWNSRMQAIERFPCASAWDVLVGARSRGSVAWRRPSADSERRLRPAIAQATRLFRVQPATMRGVTAEPDLASPTFKADPFPFFPFYEHLRRTNPVHRAQMRHTPRAWLVTRYADASWFRANRKRQAEKRAISTSATLVGAMVLARAVDDRTLSQDILDASLAPVEA